MEKYSVWLITTTIISLLLIIIFYPNYNNNEFPLFTDILKYLFYVPAYFVLTVSILCQFIYIIIDNIKHRVIKGKRLILIKTIVFIICYVFSWYYHTIIKNISNSTTILLLYSLIVILVHLEISVVLKNIDYIRSIESK